MRHILALSLILSFMSAPAFAEEVVKQGNFTGGDVGHDGSGLVALTDTGAGLELRISDLVTDPGPDLRVILIEGSVDLKSSTIANTPYIILGDLQATSGNQSYALPDGTDPARYSTAAIWCEQYQVLFIGAALQ